jgi:hypothetical protein
MTVPKGKIILSSKEKKKNLAHMDLNKEIHVQTGECTNNTYTSVKNIKGTKTC